MKRSCGQRDKQEGNEGGNREKVGEGEARGDGRAKQKDREVEEGGLRGDVWQNGGDGAERDERVRMGATTERRRLRGFSQGPSAVAMATGWQAAS